MRHILYAGHMRPVVTVLIDRTWYPGELRMWTQADDGSWTADVSYTDESHCTFLRAVGADHVRPVHEH